MTINFKIAPKLTPTAQFSSLCRWLLFGLFALTNASCSHAINKTDNSHSPHQGFITYSEINEASGIIHSAHQDNLFWVLNDSGNQPILYAINGHGEFLGKVVIEGVKNIDWEDIALYEKQEESYLVIADVGDNRAQRSKLYLHFVKEPNRSQLSPNKLIRSKPAWSQTFNYPEGPRDCESLTIDSQENKALLLTKRDKPPVLYELDLSSSSHHAKRLGTIQPLPEQPIVKDLRSIKNLIFARQPTAMDISADGKQLAVLTYTNAYLYSLSKPYKWSELIRLQPTEIELPYLSQGEALSFDRSGKQLVITTEGLPAPIITLDLGKR